MDWNDALLFITDELLGIEIIAEFLSYWTKGDEPASLEAIAEGETSSEIELTDWQKKLFWIVEIIQQHRQALMVKYPKPPEITDANRDELHVNFCHLQIGLALRNLLWASIYTLHHEAIGPWNIGIRKGWVVVKAPQKKVEPEIMTPKQAADVMKKMGLTPEKLKRGRTN